ncbi:hypothetical protein AURANDRAFT_67697 [Aureococcus anophagefferens]|uniref:Uncharacterized protein n=1 Tax=Aureococcus anophagefferens TaxID=44056 RepID=F0YM34_AURAN|nr:hypothetical protein AURANDRAFT_67697 [Aureococcus anophagefferens]EGB03831.1 hypothetical protein AURANDRAFT_67697 [Aureococcus anophagefferens]|eukprot:XP_009041489.1 hypothetical protein AURANDRAFT_67697 [Aureococcus anophagefferens]
MEPYVADAYEAICMFSQRKTGTRELVAWPRVTMFQTPGRCASRSAILPVPKHSRVRAIISGEIEATWSATTQCCSVKDTHIRDEACPPFFLINATQSEPNLHHVTDPPTATSRLLARRLSSVIALSIANAPEIWLLHLKMDQPRPGSGSKHGRKNWTPANDFRSLRDRKASCLIAEWDVEGRISDNIDDVRIQILSIRSSQTCARSIVLHSCRVDLKSSNFIHRQQDGHGALPATIPVSPDIKGPSSPTPEAIASGHSRSIKAADAR